MVEILLAAMILSVGFIMLLPAFTIGLSQSRRTLDTAMVMHLGQNAEALCRRMLDTSAGADPNFSAGNLDGNLHVYQFGSSGTQLADHQDIRVYGDPARSRYYWSMLYRFDSGDRSLAELWIMVCKRDVASKDTPMDGIEEPVALSISASAGSKSINAGSNADFMDPESGVVTNTGEVLRIASRNGSTIKLSRPVKKTFSSVYIVKYSDLSNEGNACIGVFHTFVGL